MMDDKLLIAQRSLAWHAEDSYTFLWDGYIVLVNYNRENGHTLILTTHDDIEDIQDFLFNQLNPWIRETQVADEESWD